MILGYFNWENNMHNNKTQERRDTNNFPRGNHKGENPVNSSEIESTPKVKPENIKMISIASLSLSLTWENYFSLTHAPQWVSVCVWVW